MPQALTRVVADIPFSHFSQRLAQELQSQNLADIVRHCTTAEAAVREADVIVVATSSSSGWFFFLSLSL